MTRHDLRRLEEIRSYLEEETLVDTLGDAHIRVLIGFVDALRARVRKLEKVIYCPEDFKRGRRGWCKWEYVEANVNDGMKCAKCGKVKR